MPDGLIIHQNIEMQLDDNEDQEVDAEGQKQQKVLVKYLNQTFKSMLMIYTSQSTLSLSLNKTDEFDSLDKRHQSFNNMQSQSEINQDKDKQKQFYDYKIRMQKAKKHLDKIYLKKTAFSIQNQTVKQDQQQPIENPKSLISALSKLQSGQVYEVVYKNNNQDDFISYG